MAKKSKRSEVFIADSGAFMMRPHAVGLDSFDVPCGLTRRNTSGLELLASMAREYGLSKQGGILMGRIEAGRVCVFPDGNSVFRMLPWVFGVDDAEMKAMEGKQWFVFVDDLAPENEVRKLASEVLAACMTKPRASWAVTGQAPKAYSAGVSMANKLVPGWWRPTSKAQQESLHLELVNAIRANRAAATATKAATPVPPTTPAKVAPMPTRKPQPAPTPAPVPTTPTPTGQGELSVHARALVDALAKIGGPAIKATMLQTAGIPASAWSDALSEAYRARKITRDRARTDNVYHVLAK